MVTSRRGPDADVQQTITAITERFRCRVHVMLADVGDESEVAGLLERIRAELPPLAGVAHLAGVLDDALLGQQNLDRFRTTLRPKAYGAHHLHRLTKNDDLDFFILYSSASAVLGLALAGQLRVRQRSAGRTRRSTARTGPGRPPPTSAWGSGGRRRPMQRWPISAPRA